MRSTAQGMTTPFRWVSLDSPISGKDNRSPLFRAIVFIEKKRMGTVLAAQLCSCCDQRSAPLGVRLLGHLLLISAGSS